MKSYNHLYENCISEENRRISLNLAKHSKRMRRIMKSRHLSDDALVALSYDWINNYENAEHVPVYIYDGITRKERVVIVPTMEELIVQHNVVNALKPMFCKGMYEHSYASLPGRGAHKGKRVIEKWIRTDAKNCKYVLKMDIRHFFDTVPHDKLKAKLRKTTGRFFGSHMGTTRGATLTLWDSDSSGTEQYFVKPSCIRPRKKPENFPEKRSQRYTTPIRCCHILAGLTAPILTECIRNGLSRLSVLSN